MEFLNSWLQGIIISVVIATIIEMILPNGNTKKYIKIILGIYIVFNIITPIINKFTNSEFEISSIINIEEYNKKIESYDSSSNSVNKLNEKNIKEIYINNLKNDITAKLEEKEYLVKSINLEIENDDTYQIKQIELYVLKKDYESEIKTDKENKTIINEIEKVEIQIGEKTKYKNTDEENNLKDSQKKEIKQYLSSVYEIKENKIIIN